jgi:hypothetical protein
LGKKIATKKYLIVEKVKVYAYFFYPENQAREKPLPLTAGNKIYR